MTVSPRIVTTDDLRGGSYDPYPVGSVFIAVVNTNPATLLGYGTWSAIGAGRVLVGYDSGDTDFNAAEKTGGAKTVASAGSNANESAHTHSVTSDVTVNDHASHTHSVTTLVDADTEQVATGVDVGAFIPPMSNPAVTSGGPSVTLTHTAVNNAVTSGAGAAHTHTYTGSATSVVQPYLTVFMWKRTA